MYIDPFGTMHVCMYVCTYVCAYVCMYVCIVVWGLLGPLRDPFGTSTRMYIDPFGTFVAPLRKPWDPLGPDPKFGQSDAMYAPMYVCMYVCMYVL